MAERRALTRTSRLLRDWLPTLAIIALVFVARSTLADHSHVPSGSMEPALVPGDHVVVNKMGYGLRIPFTKRVVALEAPPDRGDVVIFDSPDSGERLIKRVVAVGGDRVAVHRGRVFINDEPVFRHDRPDAEIYGELTVPLNLEHGGGPGLPPTRIPEGHALVLGDHRGNSRDGRFFGLIPYDEIYGRAAGVFWRSGKGPLWQPL